MPDLPRNKLTGSTEGNTDSAVRGGLAISRRLAWGIVMACLVAALGVWVFSLQKPAPRQMLGLMTTLPIYWGEVAGMDEMIAGTAPPHWVRSALEQEYQLVPLDTLAGSGGIDSRVTMDRVLLAQPRAFSGPENVALDNWVRGGGHVLLFADPMLTSHSRFPIGDRRRPQDVVLLSPILSRWGLELQFDEAQAASERIAQFETIDLPVHLAGTFRKIATAPGARSDCEITVGGLIADCAIGQGRALIIADAAMLDQDAGGKAREKALRTLTARAFSKR